MSFRPRCTFSALLGVLVFAVPLALATPASAQTKLKLVLNWKYQGPQGMFFLAEDRGYYKAEGLEVTLDQGNGSGAAVPLVANGTYDAGFGDINALIELAAKKPEDAPIAVYVMFNQPPFTVAVKAESAIKSPKDFKGKTLGVWFGGNEYPFLAWMAKLGLKTDGSPDGVKVIKQGFNVDPLLQKQADCISTMTYNEYWQVIDGGFKPSQLVVFKYEDEGVATLEDGLYATEARLKDPAFVGKMARFVKASMRGWDYARKNPDDAAQVVLAADTTGAQTEKHQKRMMGEIAKLLTTGDGKLDPADYERTVATLLTGGSDPVITKKPTGAWTHKIYDAMK